MKSTSSQREKRIGYLALLTTSFFWGTTWVVSKMAVAVIPSLQLSAIRQFLAGFIFVFHFLFIKKVKLPTISEFKWILILSVLMFVIANWVSTLGLKYIPTGLAALVGALYPLSVVVIETAFFKARNINIVTIAGMLLGLTGVGIVFYDTIFTTLSMTSIIGLGLSVFAMLSWSFGTIFLSKNKIKINPYNATGWQMIISSIVLSILSYSTHQFKPFNEFGWKVWVEIFYLVSVGSVLCFIAFIYSIKVLPPGIASLYAYINPLVAILVASILLNELLTINILLGAMVTVTGVFLVNLNHSKSKVISEPEI